MANLRLILFLWIFCDISFIYNFAIKQDLLNIGDNELKYLYNNFDILKEKVSLVNVY